MAADFLLYWTPETADRELASGHLLNHAGSEQLDRVAIGDTLWIVTVRSGTLILLGRFTVTSLTDRDGARRAIGYEPWPSGRHALAAQGTGEPVREISLGPIAAELRFRSPAGNDRLRLTDGSVNAQQLQSMRELTAGSVSVLSRAWSDAPEQHRRTPDNR